jgi:hypothetical protein
VSDVQKPNRLSLALLFFAGLSFLLFAFSPGSIRRMGYTGEEMDAGNSLLHRILPGHVQPTKIIWTRHGVFPLLVDAPFLAAGELFEDAESWQDRFLACRPILLTAGIATILFLWIWRLTAEPGWSLLVAILSVFSTILLPYAYIGLEDTQSFFLLLAAYIAFENSPAESWTRTIIFACSAAFAVSLKSSGVFLIPAAGFLVYVAFRGSTARIVLVSLVVAISLGLSALSRAPFWASRGGNWGAMNSLIVPDPVYYLANLFSFFFSANKGLFFFCPILIAAVITLPRLWRGHRDLVIVALLVLAAQAGGFSMLRIWSDETWGPRYLHSAIPFLMLCLGAGWVQRPSWLIVPAGVGLIFALLGGFFYYGSLQLAMTEAGQDTLENFQGDIVWNHIRFDGRLFWIWATRQTPPVLYVPAHQWYYDVPPSAGWKTIDLSKYAVPQSPMIRSWFERLSGAALWFSRVAWVALALGVILLGSVGWFWWRLGC